MTTRADRIAHEAAVKAALVATGRSVYTYDEINAIAEASRPEDYIVFDVSRVFGGAEMADGTAGSSLWRVSTRAVAQMAYNAAVILDDCRDALEGVSLTISGASTGPINFETELSVDEDQGRYSGLVSWIYDHV